MQSTISKLNHLLASPPIAVLLFLYVVVWVVSRLVSDTNLDPYGDMLENVAWGQSFSWGELKHPPLTGWIVGAWFTVFDTTHLNYHLLAYLNAAIGLAGIHALGHQLGLTRIRLAATLIMVLALPFSTLAVKVNANTILLPIWSWLTVFWLTSLSGRSRWPWLVAALLAVFASLSLLGKYFSGVLLLTFGVLTLATSEGRAWLKTPYPWFASVLFCLTLIPHGVWLYENEFATLSYVEAQGDGGVDVKQLAKFALAPLAYGLLAWVAAMIVVPGWSYDWLWRSWMPNSRQDRLFWLVWLPYIITLAFGAVGFVTLSLPWAIPLGFGLTLLWLRNLSALVDSSAQKRINDRAKNLFLGFLSLILVVSPIYAWQQGRDGALNYYQPTVEAVFEVESLWRNSYGSSDQDLYEWVAGDYPRTAAFVFYAKSDAELLDQLPRLPSSNGIMFCALGPTALGKTSNACTQEADLWSRYRDEQIVKAEFSVSKTGPRFPLDIPFTYKAYLYRHERK